MVQLTTDSQAHRPLKLIVLDRDGVINHDSENFIKSPDEWRPIPGSLEAIARLNPAGYRVRGDSAARGRIGNGPCSDEPVALAAVPAVPAGLDAAVRVHHLFGILPAAQRALLGNQAMVLGQYLGSPDDLRHPLSRDRD